MVTITVTDVNEAPTFDAATADRDVDENTEAGMAIGDPVAAMDVDADDTLTYTLDAMGDMYFDIDPATGQLMTEAALDHEMTASHTVTVTATDSDGLTDTIAVTIAVNDVGETPMFDAETAEFSVDENMYAGAAVGTVTAAQAESYSDDSDYFDVDDMGNITTAMMLDHEAMDSHMVTVTATAADGSTDSIAVTIAVNDVPETPIFEANAVEFPVDENMPVGTVVGTETAMLAESYSDDSDYFDVDGMGNITTAMMLDYESGTDTSYMVTVTRPVLTARRTPSTVTVTVRDAHPGCTVADNMGLTSDCEALLDAKGDLGGDAELGYRHRHGRLGRRDDERRPGIGYLAEGRRPGRLGLRCARSLGHADCAEPAQQLAER